MSWLARYERWQFKRSIRRLARVDALAAVEKALHERHNWTRREQRRLVRRTSRLLAEYRLDDTPAPGWRRR